MEFSNEEDAAEFTKRLEIIRGDASMSPLQLGFFRAVLDKVKAIIYPEE